MTALYGAGLYSAGLYGQADPVAPPITIPTVDVGYGAGAYGAGPDGGVLADPPATSGYGAGLYGIGIYVGAAEPATGGYGYGPYGQGLYPGVADPVTPTDPNVPNPPAGTVSPNGWKPVYYGQPLHLLGIGPWNPVKAWRGAPNYNIGRGLQPARPAMALPGVTASAFTLRLNDGCEASTELSFPRRSVVYVEEMATDLWWRRKDPKTGLLETIGRFNTSHNDMSRAADGTVTSSLQLVDYRTLLSERLVLKYNSTDPQATDSQWNSGTKITEIMRFAVPTNMGLDLSEIAVDGTDLGVTTTPITVDPSSSIGALFSNLLAISAKAWEWWVEQPADVTKAPKLRFIVGTRGRDRGVLLFDYGTGPTPIDTWTMRASTDSYANSLYFTGGEGGVVDQVADQVAEFGQRDATAGDATLIKGIEPIKKAAQQKLLELADRRPTFSLNLRSGFWKGRSHIDIGDMIDLRIKLGNELMAYRYRVSEITVQVDAANNEAVALTLGSPLTSLDPRSRNAPLVKVIRTLKNYVIPAGSTTPTT